MWNRPFYLQGPFKLHGHLIFSNGLGGRGRAKRERTTVRYAQRERENNSLFVICGHSYQVLYDTKFQLQTPLSLLLRLEEKRLPISKNIQNEVPTGF